MFVCGPMLRNVFDIVVISSFPGLWKCAGLSNWRMNEHNQHGPDSGHVWSQPCRIRRAVALMEANFAVKLSREEMARAAGFSVSHFSKLFTQCMGLSPHQYLVLCRLRHAKKLLST